MGYSVNGGFRQLVQVCVMLLGVVFVSFFVFDSGRLYYAEREVYCIDLIRAGVLYGGQTLCGNPPLVYYVGYVLSLFFGGNLQVVTFFVMMLLSGASVLLLFFYLKPVGFFELIFFWVFLVVMLVYGVLDFATTLALFFVLLSFFIVRKSQHYFLAGCCFALALSAKTIALLFVIPLLVCVVGFSKKRRLVLNSLKLGVLFLLPSIVMSVFLYVVYPFIFHYVFFAHTVLHPHWSFVGAVVYALKNFNVQHFIVLFFNVLALFVVWRGVLDALFLLPVGFWYVYITKVNSIFETGEPLFMFFFTYYFLLFFPFFFTVLFFLARGVKSKKWLYNSSLLIFSLFFVYFGLVVGSSINSFVQKLPDTPVKIQVLFQDFYDNFLYGEGVIFVTQKYASLVPEKYGSFVKVVNASQLVHPSEFGFGDPNYGLGIKSLSVFNSSVYNPKLVKDMGDFSSRLGSALVEIDEVRPSLVVVDFQNAYYAVLSDILTVPVELKNKYSFLKTPYCLVNVPVLVDNKNGLHRMNYFYKNESRCIVAKQKVHFFVSLNFDTFCDFDEVIANRYVVVTKKNGFVFERVCSSGAKGYDPVDVQIDWVKFVVLAFFVFAACLTFLWQRVRK